MLSQEEAAMNRAFTDAAQSVTVLVDSSKFHSQGVFRIAKLDKVTRIITDSSIHDGGRKSIENFARAYHYDMYRLT